ncbi:MAG TPA: glutathione S-transferase family protein [Usitatibacteraceae bacterium]
MYELYIANKNYSSWSLRPWLLMRELAIPFKEHLMPFERGSSWAAFRDFSPTGKVPCLRDGNAAIWDSLAISEYLAERHRGVWPADGGARAWARCAAAEMHSGFGALRERCSMNCGVRVRLDEITPALAKDIARLDELWGEGLTRYGGPFLAGKTFGAVDAFFAPVAFRAQSYGLEFTPDSKAYLARLLALPGMQSWYQDGLRETWREPDHEDEAVRAGTWLQDLRVPAA